MKRTGCDMERSQEGLSFASPPGTITRTLPLLTPIPEVTPRGKRGPTLGRQGGESIVSPQWDPNGSTFLLLLLGQEMNSRGKRSESGLTQTAAKSKELFHC